MPRESSKAACTIELCKHDVALRRPACMAHLRVKAAHAGAAWHGCAESWHEALLLHHLLLALSHQLLLDALLLHRRGTLVARHQLLPLIVLLLITPYYTLLFFLKHSQMLNADLTVCGMAAVSIHQAVRPHNCTRTVNVALHCNMSAKSRPAAFAVHGCSRGRGCAPGVCWQLHWRRRWSAWIRALAWASPRCAHCARPRSLGHCPRSLPSSCDPYTPALPSALRSVSMRDIMAAQHILALSRRLTVVGPDQCWEAAKSSM